VFCLALGLSVPSASAKVSKAKKREAIAASILARSALDKRNYDMAVTLYMQAYEVDPDTLGYLFSAGRACHKGGKIAAAEKHYAEFLAKSGKTKSALVDKARQYLLDVQSQQKAELKRKLAVAEAKVEAIKTADKADKKAAAGGDAPTAPTKEVANAPAAATTATTTQAPNVLAWSIAGSGVVSGAIAVMLYLDVLDQRSELDALYQQVDAKGKITGISHEEANNKSQDIETTNTTAAILGGIGVAATGLGAYMLLSKPSSSVAIHPGLDLSSVVLTMRF
jgi:tetratricopeptide (TPR) repeat protein